MSDATDKDQAFEIVLDLIQPNAAPVLSWVEIDDAVGRALLARTWTVNTSYALGVVVVPPTRNGQAYVSTQPGTSHAVAHAYTAWRDGFSEGASSPRLTWEEVGSDLFNPGIPGAERNVYDINKAARECWLLKARKASGLIDTGDTSFSQLHRHCVEQAERFKPFRRQMRLVRA